MGDATTAGPGHIKYQNNQRVLQSALLQTTNQNLVNIRIAELNYYSSFYLTFGGQSALVCGFVYGGLTQIHFVDNNQYSPEVYDMLQCIFWISCAISLCAAMHCILTSIFLQLQGPGMALHGPIGSMAKAAKGMREELANTFVSFVTMMVFLAISTLTSFYILMKFKIAVACSCVVLVGMALWWKYCIRMYNRFYLDPIHDNEHYFDDDPTSATSSSQQQYARSTRDNHAPSKSGGNFSAHGPGSRAVSTDSTNRPLRQSTDSIVGKLFGAVGGSSIGTGFNQRPQQQSSVDNIASRPPLPGFDRQVSNNVYARNDSNSEFSKLERRFSRVSSTGSNAVDGGRHHPHSDRGNYPSKGDYEQCSTAADDVDNDDDNDSTAEQARRRKLLPKSKSLGPINPTNDVAFGSISGIFGSIFGRSKPSVKSSSAIPRAVRSSDRSTRVSSESIGAWVRYGRSNRQFGLSGTVDRTASRDRYDSGVKDDYGQHTLTRRLLQDANDDDNEGDDDDTTTINATRTNSVCASATSTATGGDNAIIDGDILFAGYLTKKGGKQGLAGDSWKSRYFVLHRSGQLYYYKSKDAFVTHPNDPIKLRPIDVSVFKLKSEIVSDDTGYITYALKLIPTAEDNGRIWEMKCDFENDFQTWIKNLKLAQRKDRR